jgi:hypothetical protein
VVIGRRRGVAKRKCNNLLKLIVVSVDHGRHHNSVAMKGAKARVCVTKLQNWPAVQFLLQGFLGPRRAQQEVVPPLDSNRGASKWILKEDWG